MTDVAYGRHPGYEELRAKRDVWLARQLEHYGQERYEKILQAIDTIGEELCRRVDPLVDEAQSHSFLEFESRVNYSTAAPSIQMEFADPKGLYYVRSFGLDKLMRLHGCPLQWENFINAKLYVYVLGKPGMKRLSGRKKKLNRSDLAKLPLCTSPTVK
jgi:hypothetical protein